MFVNLERMMLISDCGWSRHDTPQRHSRNSRRLLPLSSYCMELYSTRYCTGSYLYLLYSTCTVLTRRTKTRLTSCGCGTAVPQTALDSQVGICCSLRLKNRVLCTSTSIYSTIQYDDACSVFFDSL